ncbi:hypothetical protein ACF9IK_36060 [Kitasatospora hibisci]|uniref:hypothetical protein n=1 Tax=Kitasatospora hibisci TaxID=3369522 RepID=UPI0037552361
MTESTPYDAERSAFTRAALARLVLSDTSVDLAGAAANLAITRFDDQTGMGGRVSEAAALRVVADRLLTRAVIFERERGSSWEQIAHYLDTDAADARERFTPAVDRWERAFEEPYGLDETGRKRVRQLPAAAYDPEAACRQLDLAVCFRMYFHDEHPVSGALRPSPPTDGRPPLDYGLEGRIHRRNLGLFVSLLAQFTDADFTQSDWDAVAAHVRSTDEDDRSTWDTHPVEGSTASLHVRIANVTRDDDLVEVVVTGATDAGLRLRIDTLFEALGPGA